LWVYGLGVVNIRVVIALCLGLLFQLFLLGGARPLQESSEFCCGDSQSMDCCADLDFCPCLEEGDSKQTPTPLIPAGLDLKLGLAQAPGENCPVAMIQSAGDVVIPSKFCLGARHGFLGVPVSVAFCRFVI
jgi:hypothetical protein